MNKKYLNSVLFAFFLFLVGGINAQKSQTVVFQTSAQCGMCKDRIEEVMNFVPGVQYAELNLEDMSLKIKYKTKKTTADELRKHVAAIGYTADDVEPKEEDVKKLPLCCQPGAHL
jgi:periplasmic mercuric ion binding protein